MNYSNDQSCQASIRWLLSWALYKLSRGWWSLPWSTPEPLIKL